MNENLAHRLRSLGFPGLHPPRLSHSPRQLDHSVDSALFSRLYFFHPYSMIACLAIASALHMATVPNAPTNSVYYWNNKTQLTNRVLDRSICDDTARVLPVTAPDGTTYSPDAVSYSRKRQLQEHMKTCQLHLRIEGKNMVECDLGLSQ